MEADQSSTCLKHASLLKTESPTRKRPMTCCKSSCGIRRLKNRGAVLILLWSFLVTGIFNFCEKQNHGLVFSIQLVAGGLTLSIAGWLADIYIGRYRMIRLSMWTMWVAFMLATASSVVVQFVEAYKNIINYDCNGVLVVLGQLDSIWNRPAS